MEEYSYVGISDGDNIRIMIKELEQRNSELKNQLDEINKLRSQIEAKKGDIKDMIINAERDFVELGNMLPKVKVQQKKREITQIKREVKVEEPQEIDLEKLRSEFEKLKREFSQF